MEVAIQAANENFLTQRNSFTSPSEEVGLSKNINFWKSYPADIAISKTAVIRLQRQSHNGGWIEVTASALHAIAEIGGLTGRDSSCMH
jgi:hypothetical protein